MSFFNNMKKKIAANKMAYQKQMDVLAANSDSCSGHVSMHSCEQTLSQNFYDLPVSALVAGTSEDNKINIKRSASSNSPTCFSRARLAASVVLLAACLAMVWENSGSDQPDYQSQIASSEYPVSLASKGM